MAAPVAKGGEHNYVADAHNFEQRIKVENEAAQVGGVVIDRVVSRVSVCKSRITNLFTTRRFGRTTGDPSMRRMSHPITKER